MPATGAYTLSMASNYNGVTRPAAVLVGDGEARLIRRRETHRRPPANGGLTTSADLKDAAVLAPVFRDAHGVLRILLLLRTDHGIHGGQLGLPGGRPEPGDRDLLATALREAEEEVGLAPEHVEVLAALDPVETQATGFRVHPFLGRVPADLAWRPQPDEVAGCSLPPSQALADPAARRRLPFTSSYFREPFEVEGIDVEGHVLWGMTLRLLDDLVPRLLAGEWDV